MADGKTKVFLAISCIYVLVFVMIYIFAGVLLFGNSSDNPSFIKAFQVLWCVGIVLFVIGSIVSVVDYLTGMRISAHMTAQFVPLEQEQQAELAQSIRPALFSSSQMRMPTTVSITVIWLVIFLCTFFILFTDAENNQHWMTALLVCWYIFIAVMGLALIVGCCVCCAAVCVIARSATNSETRPFANQTTTGV
jgi:hypothetical protein